MREIIMVAIAITAIVWEVQNDFAFYNYMKSVVGMAAETADGALTAVPPPTEEQPTLPHAEPAESQH